LRAGIASGDFPAHTRLPPERQLAAALALSRTTVVTAYDVLRAEGLVESRQGSGTWVRRQIARAAPTTQERELGQAFRRNVVFRGLLETPASAVQFLAAHLPPLPQVEEAWRAALKEDWPTLSRHHGYAPLGYAALRQSIADHFTRGGLSTRPEQVLVTSGAQQAISLVAALLVQRGERVVVENPTYLGAIDVFASTGATLVPIPVGVPEPEEAFAEPAALIYLVPTFHNPTGAVMPERRRRRLAHLAEEHQVPIVEDNSLAGLVLGADPPAPIAAFGSQAPIITIGSMSKLYWGGLRVGWLRARADVIARLARLRALHDLGSPLLSQAVAARLLKDEGVAEATRRREIRPRLDALLSSLRQRLPEWSWERPAGGLLLWARLPRGNADDLSRVAGRHGVSIVPGSVNSPDGRFGDHVRLPFALPPAEIRDGIDRLAHAWATYDSPQDRPAGLDVIV
jgi:DNA-binding transcriptional MocR family regulator